MIALHALQVDGASRTTTPAAPGGGTLPILVMGTGRAVDWRFVEEALRRFASDPRIASVSHADSAVATLAARWGSARLSGPSRTEASLVFAAEPAGTAVVLNPAVLELVDHPYGAGSAAAVRDWAHAATARGLRHAWWYSGAVDRSPPAIPLGSMDNSEAADPASAVGHLIDRHRAAHHALTVGIDAEWLGPSETGAQVAVVEWLKALAGRSDIESLTLVRLPGRLPSYAAALGGLPKIRIAGVKDDQPEVDVFWRPYQPNAASAAFVDRQRARRLVATVLDLIKFSNRSYHADNPSWQAERRALRRYLLEADLVTGISADVVEHLLTEVPGLDRSRMRRTTLGVEHLASTRVADAPPDLLEAWPQAAGATFLLVLGNDYLHKNRDLAIKIWLSLSDELGVDLVLAGLHVGTRSTRTREDALLRSAGSNSGRLIRLDHVSSQAKRWLMSRAAVVLYPTSAEGFGFIPHEAAVLGVPSLSTSFGPLREFLPETALTEGWGVSDYAARLAALLSDPSAGHGQVADVRGRDRKLTWEAGGASLALAFRDALALPVRSAGPSGVDTVASFLAAKRLDVVRSRVARRRGR